MIEPSRLTTPFLPPEVTSKILQFVHSKPSDPAKWSKSHIDFAPLSLINSGWRNTAQERLFEVIEIESLSRFHKLIEIRSSGLMQHITSLTFNLQHLQLDSDDIFLLFQFTMNLKFLHITLPSDFGFSPLHTIALRSRILLPELITLHLGWGYQGNISVLDDMVATSPKITSLVPSLPVVFSILPFSSTLNYLKHLVVKDEKYILTGDIWSFDELEGLEKLELQSIDSMDSLGRLWEVIGPTLLEFKAPPAFSSTISPHLVRLEKLDIHLDTDEELLTSLPSSLIELRAQQFQSLSISTFSHLKNLKIIEIDHLVNAIDFTSLPSLSVLRIRQAEKEKIILALNNFAAESKSITELALGECVISIIEQSGYSVFQTAGELTEDQEIIIRCEELGIHLVKYIDEYFEERKAWDPDSNSEEERYRDISPSLRGFNSTDSFREGFELDEYVDCSAGN